MPRAKYLDWEAEDKLEQIRKWVKDGLSDSKIAEQMGITKSLLSVWRRKRPKIRLALTRLVIMDDGAKVDKHDLDHAGGRRKLNNVQELKQKIDTWIADKQEADEVMTRSGLCLYLNISKDTMNKYMHEVSRQDTVLERSEIDGELHSLTIADLLKRANLAIESDLERRMISGKGNVAGIIFDLKNNHGYADKSEVNTVNTSVKAVSDEDIDKRIAELMNKAEVFRRSS
jgi:hypothetical protein|nr:MAG TPA: DNA packaging protein gp3 [Caudoviricetes sp.]